VLSLYRTGALKMQLEPDSYKLDIIVMQELMWLDKGVMEKKDYVLFYSCQAWNRLYCQ
jgi:hypothetical protein